MLDGVKKYLNEHEGLENIYPKVIVFVKRILWYPYIALMRIYGQWSKKVVFCECFVNYKCWGIKRNNWGDDINKFFFEYVTGKKFVFVPYSRLSIRNIDVHYSLIGSIIGFYNLENTIIYGSGIGRPDVKIIGTPKKIISVRGPLTRKVLCEKKMECPEKYGDPALLLPLFYCPDVCSSNQICVILNMGTEKAENKALEILVQQHGCKCIDMTEYKDWRDIIDEIRKSSFIISESLHGLIVAETYGIPNVWVEFKEHHEFWWFKFCDYFESIGKFGESSIKLYNGVVWSELLDAKEKWVKGKINYEEMRSYFPYEIQQERVFEKEGKEN